MRARPLVRTALLTIAVALLGACATIPERAWSNGQAMSNSRAHRQAMSGDMSLRTHSELRTAANPLRLNHTDRPYAPFTHWW